MNKSKSCVGFLLTVIVLTILIAAVESSRSGAQVRSGYGEYCNKTVRCKTQSWLSCDRETNTCQCTKVDEMMLDESTGKCVVLIGERCKYGIESDEDDDSNGGRGPYEKAECVPGAVCGPSGLCSCPKGFYEDDNKCLPVKGFGATCTIKQECNQEKFLSCIGGQCRCDSDISVYNNQTFQTRDNYGYNYISVPSGLCIGRVGTACSTSLSKYCVLNAQCGDGICKCKSEFTETSDRLCGLNYQATCSESNICSDKFQCSLGYNEQRTQNQQNQWYTQYTPKTSCDCPHAKNQEYDIINKICKGAVGASCSPSGGYDACTDNAVCRERDLIYQCECLPGFVQTSSGKCEIEYGQPCIWSDRPISPAQMCDQFARLRCKGGKCACRDDDDIYEASRRQCSIPVGLRCSETSQCVENSICAKELSVQLAWGRCACKPNFEVVKNHTCVYIGNIEKSKDDNSGSEEDVQPILSEKST